MLRRALTIAVVLAFSVPFLAHADDSDSPQIQVGRYITLTPDTALDQRLPLLSAVDIRLPSSVTWLRTALEYVLRDTGYSLAPNSWHCPEIRALFDQPVIAWTQRRFERVSVLEILYALAGPSFVIQLDPVSRKIAFDLAPAFQTQPVEAPAPRAVEKVRVIEKVRIVEKIEKVEVPAAAKTETTPTAPQANTSIPIVQTGVAPKTAMPTTGPKMVRIVEKVEPAQIPEVANTEPAPTVPQADTAVPIVRTGVAPKTAMPTTDPKPVTGEADIATAAVTSTGRFANPFLKAPVEAVPEPQAYVPSQPPFRAAWEQ